MPASDFNAAVREGLRDAANLFVKEMKAKISSEDSLPDDISDATRIEGPFQSGEGSSIDIVIDLKQAPMAAAYEWGSGVHATRGKRGEYPITGDPLLAFPKERWLGYEPPPNREFFVFPFVMHPGVKAVPYIAPTIEETKVDIARMIGEALITTYIGDEKVIEIHAK
jgi:hypothetical protein